MIEIRNLCKTFKSPEGEIDALKNVSLTVEDGDICGIIGMSGAGKSTLVKCINLLELPTSGEVILDGKNLSRLNKKELLEARRKISTIFQGFNLLMQKTCLENVCFPLKLQGIKGNEAKKIATELLGLVGLPDKLNEYPARLSGGQQQRVAIARALATKPRILLCDEATSALDPQNTQSILRLIKEINLKLGITVIMITHQMSVVEEICNKVAILENGCVIESGNTIDIFTKPQTEGAKRLVSPEDENQLSCAGQDERIIKIIFSGAKDTGKPLITQLAIDEGIAANVIYASSRRLGDKIYGKMLCCVPADEDTFTRAFNYISNCESVSAEEVVRAK